MSSNPSCTMPTVLYNNCSYHILSIVHWLAKTRKTQRGKPIFSLPSYTIFDEIYFLFYTWNSDCTSLERLQKTTIEQEARIRGALGRPGACSAQRDPICSQNVSIRYLYNRHCHCISIMWKLFIMILHLNSFHLLCSWIFTRQKISYGTSMPPITCLLLWLPYFYFMKSVTVSHNISYSING